MRSFHRIAHYTKPLLHLFYFMLIQLQPCLWSKLSASHALRYSSNLVFIRTFHRTAVSGITFNDASQPLCTALYRLIQLLVWRCVLLHLCMMVSAGWFLPVLYTLRNSRKCSIDGSYIAGLPNLCAECWRFICRIIRTRYNDYFTFFHII